MATRLHGEVTGVLGNGAESGGDFNRGDGSDDTGRNDISLLGGVEAGYK
jgi:hypothetical protein